MEEIPDSRKKDQLSQNRQEEQRRREGAPQCIILKMQLKITYSMVNIDIPTENTL